MFEDKRRSPRAAVLRQRVLWRPAVSPLAAASTCLATAALALAGCTPAADQPAMSGYVEAEYVYVSAASAGVLRQVSVRRGDAVKQGQPLFALETEAEAFGREAAAARRAGAEAQVRNLQKGRRPAELAAIEQQLAQAQAALAASSAALQRNQTLVQQGFQSASRLDELIAARDRDAARIRELQAQRTLALDTARADEIAAAAASAEGSAADLSLARWREGQRQRSAPLDATVHDLMYRPGEWVHAGTPVIALLPAQGVKLRFFVPQPALPQALVGRELAVSCDGCAPGLKARIRFVATQAEFTPPVIYSNSSRSKLVFLAEAEPLQPAAFRPGQPVDVRFAELTP
ncbi:MAG: HlyD family efflux transporter periplasmic adaptor subunit [Rubrivivax sp.]|nr:HlyD family efflux transporter periplasmic adaptor subunit [Rubrivivax sp.]